MSDPVIQARGLRKTFGTRNVLDAVSFDVHPGEVIGVLGKNGAGKTTLLEVLLGFAPPTAGDARVFGHPSMALPASVKRRMGFVPQQDELLDQLTAAEQLRLVASFYPAWDNELVSRLCTEWSVNPKARIKNLSVGERQKLSILMAFGRSRNPSCASTFARSPKRCRLSRFRDSSPSESRVERWWQWFETGHRKRNVISPSVTASPSTGSRSAWKTSSWSCTGEDHVSPAAHLFHGLDRGSMVQPGWARLSCDLGSRCHEPPPIRTHAGVFIHGHRRPVPGQRDDAVDTGPAGAEPRGQHPALRAHQTARQRHPHGLDRRVAMRASHPARLCGRCLGRCLLARQGSETAGIHTAAGVLDVHVLLPHRGLALSRDVVPHEPAKPGRQREGASGGGPDAQRACSGNQAPARSRALWLRGEWSRAELFTIVERSCWRHNGFMSAALLLTLLGIGTLTKMPWALLAYGVPLLVLGTVLSTYLGLMLTRGISWIECALAAAAMLTLMTVSLVLGAEDIDHPAVLTLLGAMAASAVGLRQWARRRWRNIDWSQCRGRRVARAA